MRRTGTQRREDRITNQAKNRANRLKLEDQNLIKRYDTSIEEAKRGNLKSGFTQTSLTGMKQNWSEIPQKEGLSTLDQQIRNLIFASNNAQSDQEAGAYMAAAWELQNKWDVQEDQDTTYTRAASQDMTAIDQNQEDKKNMSPSEFFGTNQYGEGGSADPTNVAETTSVKKEKNKTLESKGMDQSSNEIDSDEFEGDNAPGMKDRKTIFLEDTANSPAAKAGLDDDLRWQARQRYEDFLKKRNVKSSLGKARG